MADLRRLHPRLTATDLESEPFIPELSPVVNPHGDSLMTRPWLDWARRLTLLVGVNTGGGGGTGTGDVVGPDGATPDAIAIYSGSTGKLIKDSLTSIGSVISQAVSQAIAAILPGGKLPVSNLPLHKTTHQAGGVDAVDVKLLAGFPANNAVFLNGAGAFTAPVAVAAAHATTHSAAGSDPVTVTNLAGYPGGTTSYLRADGTFATPTAGVPGPHHATHEVGGADVLVNAAWTNQPNVFTQDQTVSKSPGPRLLLTDQSVPVDTKVFRISNEGQGLRFIPQLDNGTPINTGVVIGRQGNIEVAGSAYVTGSVGNVACKDQANVFTQLQKIADNTQPSLLFNNTGRPAGSRQWKLSAFSDGLFYIQPADDSNVSSTVSLKIDPTNNVTIGNNLTVSGSGGNVACKDQTNVFTQPQTLQAGGSVPRLVLNDTSTVAGNRVFDIVNNAQVFQIRALNDAATVVISTPITVYRGGGVAFADSIAEYNRPVAMGHWTNVPFNAADFTAAAPMGLTVAAGNVPINRYTLIGKTLIWTVYIAGGTMYGASSNVISLRIPGGFSSVGDRCSTPTAQLYDGTHQPGYVTVDGVAPTYIKILKAFETVFTLGALYTRFTISMEIN